MLLELMQEGEGRESYAMANEIRLCREVSKL